MRLWPESDGARVTLLLTALLLSGCAEMQGVQSYVSDTFASGKNAGGSTAAQTASLPPAVAPAPESLVGVDSSALIAAMGTPDFKRLEPGAEIWRYSAPQCQVLIFLYENETGALTSSHLTARRAGGGEVDLRTCLQNVADARAHRPTG